MNNYKIGSTMSKEDFSQDEYTNMRAWAKANNCYVSLVEDVYTICEDIVTEEDKKMIKETEVLTQAEKDAEFLEQATKWGLI